MDPSDEEMVLMQAPASAKKKQRIILTASSNLLDSTTDNQEATEITISSKRTRNPPKAFLEAAEDTTGDKGKSSSKTPNKTPSKASASKTPSKTPTKSANSTESSSGKTPSKSTTKTPAATTSQKAAPPSTAKKPSAVSFALTSDFKDEDIEEIPEDEIDGAIFNEIDPNDDSGETLRTVAKFSIYKKDTKEMITLDEIEANAGNVAMSAIVVEPYPADLRETMLNILSTTDPNREEDRQIETNDAMEQEERDSADESEAATPSTVLNWDRLTVGDLVDGYCPRTYQWYEAKIVQADRVQDRFKVHFQGWNSKYDEWINKGSERLIPFKTSKLLLQEVEKAAKYMVPWFQTTSLLENASNKLKKSIPKRAQQGIYIPDVVDWCIDYTYANPTLWVISSSDIWYRIAGALAPNGCFGSPKQVYKPVFQHSLEKYLATAHVAMAVLDVFSTIPTASFQVIVDEVNIRSKGVVNEVTVLEHHQFIAEQIVNITPPAEWNPKTTIRNSIFMNHLRKEGDAYIAAGGMEALRNGSYKGQGMKKRLSIIKELLAEEGFPTTPGDSKKRKRPTASAESDDDDLENVPKSSSKKKTPIEYVPPPPPPPKKEFLDVPTLDEKLWTFISRRKPEALDPFPHPVCSRQLLTDLPDSMEKFTLIEQLLFIYNVANNFKIPLALTEFSIFDLQASIVSSEDIGLLRAVCISMLEEIMKEKRCKGSNRNTLKKLDEVEDENEQDKYSKDNLPWSLPILLPIYDKVADSVSIEHFLRTGEAWQEVLLHWIRFEYPDLYSSLAIDEIDPMVLCQQLLDDMSALCENTAFLSADKFIDTQYAGYRDSVEEVMDLKIIRFRLENGWYDNVDSSDNSPQDLSGSDSSQDASFVDATVVDIVGEPDAYFIPGQLVDAYHVDFKRWYEAIVVGRDYADEIATQQILKKKVIAYRIRYIGWPHDFEDVIPIDDDRVLPYRAASGQRIRRAMTPDEIYAEFPEYINVSSELSGDVKETYALQSSRGRGHIGFAEDVRHITHNWIQYCTSSGNSTHQELLEESKRLLNDFEEKYQVEVLHRLNLAAYSKTNAFDSVFASGDEDSIVAQTHRVNQSLDVWKLKLQQFPGFSEQTWNEMVSSSDMLQFYSFLAMHDQSLLSLQMNSKVRVLHWLCTEFLSTEFARNQLNKMRIFPDKNEIDIIKLIPALILKEEIKDETKEATEDNEQGNDEEDANGRPKRIRKSISQEALQIQAKKIAEEEAKAAAAEARKNKLLSAAAAMEDARPEPTAAPITNMEDFIASKCMGRFEPLGKDRFGNQYWSFSNEVINPAIFCEKHEESYSIFCSEDAQDIQAQSVSPAWHRYAHPTDISALLQWLNEYGYDESILLKNIIQWTVHQGMTLSLPSAEVIVPTSEATASDMDVAEHDDTRPSSSTKSTLASVPKVADVIKIRKGRKKTDASVSYEFVTHCRNYNFQLQVPPVVNNAWMDAWLKEYHEAKAMDFTEYAVEHGVYLLRQVTFTSTERQLGMGVKQIHGKYVFVTSFVKEQVSLAEKAGIRVGDRVLVAGNQYVDTIAKLQSSIKSLLATIPEASSDHNGDVQSYKFPILIYRLKDPLKEAAFKELHFHSQEIRSSLQRQLQLEQQQLQSNIVAIKSITEQENHDDHIKRYVYSNIEVPTVDLTLSAVLKLSEDCNHPACTTAYWRKVQLPQWIVKIATARSNFHTQPNNARKDHAYLRLIQTLTSFFLALEADLFHMSTMQHDDWISTSSRLRVQWRQLCKSTFRHETLSYLVGILRGSIDWVLYKQCTTAIPSNIIKQSLQDIHVNPADFPILFKENMKVIYFKEGHTHAMEQIQKYYALKYVGNHQLRKRAVFWGESTVPTLASSSVLMCHVKQVKVFTSLIPFAQVTLEVKATNAPAVPKLFPPFEKKECNRLLEKVLAMIKKSHNHKVFLEPVSVEEYPDYYEVVKRPMDIATIEYRIQKEKYASPHAFLEDMKLIYENCCLYNGADSKKFPPIAESMWKDATKFCEAMFGTDALQAKKVDEKGSKRNSPVTTTADVDTTDITAGQGEEAPAASSTTVLAVGEESAAGTAKPSTIPIPSSIPTTTTTSASSSSSNPVAKTFTVCIRLDTNEDCFLVDYDLYAKSIRTLTTAKVTIGASVVHKLLPVLPGESQKRYATGVVVGAKNTIVNNEGAAGSFIPWEYMKVDWIEPQDMLLSDYVNPWEVQIDSP